MFLKERFFSKEVLLRKAIYACIANLGKDQV